MQDKEFIVPFADIPKIRRTPLALAILVALSPNIALAASFTIENGEVVTTPQVLDDNESGTIEAGGELNTVGNIAVNAPGATVTINNNGSISTSGDSARGILSSGSDATINNSGSITTSGTFASSGIRSEGSSATIENSGSITTSGTSAHGIHSIGSDATINNSGSISTSGSNSYAIRSDGNSANIYNSHIITTSGADGFGIFSNGTNANINNNGNITTNGSDAYGINSRGSDATINNSGNISTTSSLTYGINSIGSDATINNSGGIITSGSQAHGIFSNDVNATINNFGGSITTSGSQAHGIVSGDSNATIDNSGNISTSGSAAYGIFSNGANATINNTGGTITTSGDSARGIYSTGSDATINNSGSINTSGENSHGIRSENSNASISNTGLISTSGQEAFAISSSGSDAIITNDGSLTTSGVLSDAIISTGANATIINNGQISTTGDNTAGILSNGANAVITNTGSISVTNSALAAGIAALGQDAVISNSGFISAVSPNSYAIIGHDGNNATLNLLTGSQIIGRIDLGGAGDNDTANVYAGGISSQLTFENTENINVFGNGVLNGNTVTTVDATGESARSVALSGMTSSIHGVINQRMNHAAPLKSVQLASLELSDGMYFEEQRPVAWSQVFGGTMDRDATGNAMAYGYDHAGINFGYEWDMAGHRVGVLGGLVRGKTESELASFETESDNYYVGAYANRKAYGLNITGSLLAGYGDNDNDRLVVDNLNGFETASADFSSWFISPGISIGSAFDIADRLEFRPSVSVNYSIAWLDSYTEKGTTNANLSVDDRKLQALTARAQLAAAYQLSDTSEFELRAGVNSRHTNDDDTKVGIAGSQFRFANAGDESVTGGFAGAALRVMNDNNFTLIADVEFGGNSDEDYAAGSLTLQYAF